MSLKNYTPTASGLLRPDRKYAWMQEAFIEEEKNGLMSTVGDLEQKVDRAAVNAVLKRSGDILRVHQNDPNWRCVLDDCRLKTAADLAVNEMICNELNAINPNIPVFSEEGDHVITERPDIYWLIDPIDGTASWLNGFEGYVTQVALVVRQIAVFGSIYHPASGRLWYNDKSGRVYCNDDEVTWPEARLPPWRLIDNYQDPEGLAANMMNADEIGDYIECGSLGLKTILTLAEAEIFVKATRFRDWDMAPALALVASSNGVIDLTEEFWRWAKRSNSQMAC